jgi:hypothetical protein
MTRYSRQLAVLAIIAAGILPAAMARAQSYAQPAPLYPYAVQQDQPHAVQVAPNTYVIRRPAQTRDYPYVRCVNCGNRANVPATAPAAHRFDRPHKPVDRALVEELRKRTQSKNKESEEKEAAVNTTKIVRDAPVVVEHKRHVDDPPRVIERRHIVDHESARAKCKRGIVENCDTGSRASGDDAKKRVIDADAEITILGPDRMSIRLFRKGHGPSAKASDGE